MSSVEVARAARPRWPFVILTAVGVALIVVPIVTGMFPRTVKGEAMIDGFAPFVSESAVAGFRSDLAVLGDARTTVLDLRARGQEPGGSERIDKFVGDYPGIRSDIAGMIDTIDERRGDYQRLAGLPPFGTLPWLLALPGVLLTAAGVFGFRRAADGETAPVSRSVAALAGVVLVAVPVVGGLFGAASAGQPVIDGFRPLLTQTEVRKVQGYFVTLVAADGELNSRYLPAVRAAHPEADLAGLTTLESRWQPMTSRFAALIGAMNDNIENFDAVAALNDSTKPLGFGGFRALGWFYLVPGALVLAVLAAGIRKRDSATAPGGTRK
ncbi:hypothetical protein BJY24_003757 [Nocardia transvalensis]|uniref:Uncharacterized protein n=1 Tax=Nocardia transvalensis TaxID=37333 RepID=A0A7W9PFC9_9NOCA|nr:hypothetical protein [Nocardia transvalensis]MBB5914890.1 hypothetical protein [Nocardia transvalensis]